MQRFGEKLRILRKRQGMTMKELATALDLASHSSIGDLESGRQTPATKIVIKIAQLFDVTTDQLLMDHLEVDE